MSRKRPGLRFAAAIAASAVTLLGAAAGNAAAAISVSRAELSGTQLRVEGSGAVPNHAVTVSPGGVSSNSDSNGAFKIQSSTYQATTCTVTVSDGSSSASARLSGCSISSPTPTPSPSPTGPIVTLTPSSLTYGPQDLNTTSAPQTITVKNTGTGPFFVNSAVTRGTDPLDFTQVDDQCSGVTVAAGSSCSVSIVFKPINVGTRSASFIITDNAPNSPQTVPITGTGQTGPGQTAPPLAFDDQFNSCSGGVCAVAPGSDLLVNNFFNWAFRATGGTEPYTFSGSPPAGFTLRPSGLLFGTKTTVGTVTFPVTVTDGAGSRRTETYSITTNPKPAPTPPGCQTGGTVREPLSGPAIGGKAPTGEASADESQLSGCGGFTVLTVRVSNVNLPDGTRLWVNLDFGGVGLITLKGGSGTMAAFVMQIGLRRDGIDIYNGIPDRPGVTQILTGGFFS